MKSIIKRLVKPVALTLIAITLASLFSSVTAFHRLVYVYDNGKTRILYTQLEKPEEILKEANIPLGTYDSYTYKPKRKQVYALTLDRAYPVSVKVGGEQKWAPMKGETVEEALKRAGVVLEQQDTVTPALTEHVTKDTQIVVTTIRDRERSETVTIPYETVTRRSPLYKNGQTKVVQEGVNGQKTTLYKEHVVNGVVEEQKVLKETIDKQPTTKIVISGDKSAHVSTLEIPDDIKFDENGNPVNYTKKLTGKATAYSARKGAKTASGRYAIVGHVAVNPKIIPYGSKLFIKSTDGSFIYGYAIAADTGTALMDGRVLVDVFFDTYEESCAFGAKKMDVYVLS